MLLPTLGLESAACPPPLPDWQRLKEGSSQNLRCANWSDAKWQCLAETQKLKAELGIEDLD